MMKLLLLSLIPAALCELTIYSSIFNNDKQFEAYSTKLFDVMDKNQNSLVDKEEYAAFLEKNEYGFNASIPFEQFDEDKDGQFTVKEFQDEFKDLLEDNELDLKVPEGMNTTQPQIKSLYRRMYSEKCPTGDFKKSLNAFEACSSSEAERCRLFDCDDEYVSSEVLKKYRRLQVSVALNSIFVVLLTGMIGLTVSLAVTSAVAANVLAAVLFGLSSAFFFVAFLLSIIGLVKSGVELREMDQRLN